MELLDDYFALQAKIHAYFGYVEDWRVIPLSDERECFWRIEDGDEGSVVYADSEEGLNDEDGGERYSDDIYTQRHLPKWVYRGEKYTMICCDPHVDGNVFLRVFDNAKERR